MQLFNYLRENQPIFEFQLNFDQDHQGIEQDVMNYYDQYKPKVIAAEGLEADYVLRVLAHCSLNSAIALKYPALHYVDIQALMAKNHVSIILSPDHPNFIALQQLYDMPPEYSHFEDLIQNLHSSYILGILNV